MNSLEKIKAKYIAGRDLIIHKTSGRVAGTIVFLTSTGIIITALGISHFNPCPSQVQYVTIRVLIAMGLFGFFSVLPNAFKSKLMGKTIIDMAILLFLTAMIWSPASAIVNDECDSKSHLTGTVWLGNERLAGAKVRAPLLNEIDETNSSGEFNLPFDNSLKGQPVELTVSYRQLEKRLSIAALDDKHEIRIEFADTLTQLTDSLLIGAIEAHIAKNQSEVRAQLKKLLLSHNKKPSSRKTIEQRLAVWERLEGGERNEITFGNGFVEFNTLRSVEAAGLLSDRVMLSTGWGMKTPQFFLINWQNEIEKRQNQSTVKLELLIFNQANDQYELVGRNEYKLRARTKHNVKYPSPLQLVHVKLEYSPQTNWKKYSKIKIIGNLPIEEYWLEFKNATWEVVDASHPE